MAGTSAAQTNLDVDYVIVYRVPNDERDHAITLFRKLIRDLASVGLESEVRIGDETSLLVFVRSADEKVFGDVVYRSRIQDWLNGVRQTQPEKDTQKALKAEPLTDAERYRQVHQMITGSRKEGGAGITPKHGEWKNVEAVFPLHNHAQNKQWLNEWSRKTFLTPDDLDQIRNAVGEKIAYYYAFLQSYFTFLIFPAAFGFSCWVLLGHFSPLYAVVNGLWCIIFVEWWKHQETDLALRWGVKGISTREAKRKEFKWEKTVIDPVTGETIHLFPTMKRFQRQLLQIPFALSACIALGTLIATCFGIEVFLSEVYDGPLKSVLVFIPTGLLTVLVPTITTVLSGFAERLTDYENYETQDAYDRAMISKLFVLNFITSYLPVILTAFVYIPFGSIIVPYLDVFSLTVKPITTNEKEITSSSAPGSFSINPARLRKQVIYFAITAQIVNFALETVVPLIKQKGTSKYKEMQNSRAEKKGGAVPAVSANDHPEEKDFLAQVREEARLQDYDVSTDLREMCIQYGYLALFSVVWPLVPLCYLINNWIELRGDTFKLTVESKRPNPERADSIGPWLDSLGFLTWFGSITSAALVYMFSNDGMGPGGHPRDIKLWALLLTVFFSEHIYLVVRLVVRTVISKLESENVRKDRGERFMMRKRYLEEAGLGNMTDLSSPPMSPIDKDFKGGMEFSSLNSKSFTRESLEEDAREGSLKDSTPSTRFWGRQKGWKESELVGMGLIEGILQSGSDSKKKR